MQSNRELLLDITGLFKEYWKTIIGFIFLGIAGATLYLYVTPNLYEATAQIKMARTSNLISENNISSTNNLRSIYVEEPQALIARMAIPTTYTGETTVLCGLTDKKDAEIELTKKVNLSILNGANGIVDLKIRDASKELAVACTNAIYQLIKSTQAQIIAPDIDVAKKKLSIEEGRLNHINQMIIKADKSDTATLALYLSISDETRYLIDRIAQLKNFITSFDSSTTHLTAPIYLKDKPVYPRKSKSLLIGLLLGMFFGLAFVLAKTWYRSN